jgi:hypothetical protein
MVLRFFVENQVVECQVVERHFVENQETDTVYKERHFIELIHCRKDKLPKQHMLMYCTYVHIVV